MHLKSITNLIISEIRVIRGLHRIHEILLRPVKNNQSGKKQYYGKPNRISQPNPGHIPGSQESKSESFYNAGHWICKYNPLVFFRNL